MIARSKPSGWTLAAIVAVATTASVTPAAAQTRTVALDEAVSLALQVNPQVVQARGQVRIAGAGRREALGNWLPTLSASSGYSTNSSTRFDPTTQREVTAASGSYSAGLNASLTLFDGLTRFARSRSASADLASADASLVNQRFQVTLQTKQAFFNALAANELLRVSDTRVQRARRQLQIARDKLAAGSAIRSDTLQSFVELQNAQLQRLNAETDRATAEAGLARLIGVDGTVRPAADSSLFAPIVADTAILRNEAVANAPTVAQAEAAADAAAAQLAISRSQYLPTVSASYSNSLSGADIAALNPSWSLRFSLSWPIFNGFTRETGLTRSSANRETALAQAEDARRQVNAQFTQYLASLESARTRFEIAQASHAAATEDLRIQQERYRLGAATIVDVLTSQVNLDQAEVDIVRSQFDYLVAKAQLEALIGREL